MTTVLVVSDTHGSSEYIQKVLHQVAGRTLDLVIHLGDDFSDAEPFMAAGYYVERIPGTWCPAYEDRFIENRRFIDVQGWTLFLTHTPTVDYHDFSTDPVPEKILNNQICDLFLHGHTHRPAIRREGRTIVLNPGHLKKGDTRGYPPTYAILEFTDEALVIMLTELLKNTPYLTERFKKL